jgi:Uma2 family endonuclease
MSRIVPRKPVPFTYQEYVLLPDDGKRHELIEGDFYVTPAPGTGHQTISGRLFRFLASQLEDPGVARVFAAPTDVLVEESTCVQPDLVVVRSGGQARITPRAIEGVPDLVIEILSPSSLSNDRLLKRNAYARLGIPEFWLVDPKGIVTVLRSEEKGRYDLEARFDRSMTLTSEEFKELAIPLEKVFAQG